MKAENLIDDLLEDTRDPFSGDTSYLLSGLSQLSDKRQRQALQIFARMRAIEDRGRTAMEKVWAWQDKWDREVDRLEKMGVELQYDWGDVMA